MIYYRVLIDRKSSINHLVGSLEQHIIPDLEPPSATASNSSSSCIITNTHDRHRQLRTSSRTMIETDRGAVSQSMVAQQLLATLPTIFGPIHFRHETHDGTRFYVCRHCSHRCEYFHSASSHYYNVHCTLPPLKCSSCPRRFKRPEQRERHEVREHRRQAQVRRCDQCDMSFDSVAQWHDHFKHGHRIVNSGNSGTGGGGLV